MRLAVSGLLLLASCSPVAPTEIHAPTTARGQGRPYPRQWMERRMQDTGYNCFACHEALETSRDRSN